MTEVDDIQSFIAAQKRRIEEERAGFSQPSIGQRNVTRVSYEKEYKTPQSSNNTNVPRQEQPKAAKEETSSLSVLQLGAYESVQEKLKKERAEEYRKFLAEKSFRSTGQKSSREKPVEKPPPMKSALKHDYGSSRSGRVNPNSFNGDLKASSSQKDASNDLSDQRIVPRASRARPQRTLEELYDAYEELLERKRQDERRYRGAIDDPYLDPRHVRFEDETRRAPQRETWLENGTRRKWDAPDEGFYRSRTYSNTEDSRTLEEYQERPSGRRQEEPDDRVSRSAPPTAVPIFGENDMSPEVKQRRQTKYREELQAQMKEREMQKKREKNHVIIDDSRKQDKGLNSLMNGGESSLGSYQPSFSRTEQSRREQPYLAPQDIISQRYQPSLAQEITSQRYQSTLPQSDGRLPPTLAQTHMPINQFDSAYNRSYLNQPLQYPPGLLSTGPPLSTLNPSSGFLGGYSSSLREPFGGYQPSWAADNSALGQRNSGLVMNLDAIGGITDRNPPVSSRPNQNNGGFNGSLSNAFSGFGLSSQADKEKERSRQQSYRDELTQQLLEKEARKKKDKEEGERYNLKLERELEEYNPWGKAGGGAPLRDHSGRLVSDLRTMHQYNKEGTVISPRGHTTAQESSLLKENIMTSSEVNTTAVSPVAKVDQFQPSPIQTKNDGVQKNAQQEYKEYLKQQVEEKQRKKKEEEERLREIEERQDKIIQEQQQKLKAEYEKELEAAKQKEEAARQKNEELRRAAEEKKKELQRKRLEEDKKQEEKLKKQLEERLKVAKANNQANRSESPPIPSAQTATRSNSPPIPTLQKKVEELQRPASPPIPTLQNKQRFDLDLETKEPEDVKLRPNIQRQHSVDKQLSRPSTGSRKPRSRPTSGTADIDVLSQLTSLRRQLKKEEIKVQRQLSENEEKYVKLRENSGARRNKKPAADVFDNVFRKQPSASQKYHDAQSSGAINEFNKLKYEENSSLHGDFLNQYPEPATSVSTLDLQQKSLLQEQQKRLESFREETSDKENLQSFGNTARPPSNTSLLASDSQFVPVNDPAQVPQVDKQSPRMPSARERRRWKELENLSKASKLSDYKPPAPSEFSLNSVRSFNVDELAQKNEDRLRRLEAMKQARTESKGDPNEVLKRFIQQHSRPDSKVSENSLPADKRYLPNM